MLLVIFGELLNKEVDLRTKFMKHIDSVQKSNEVE